MVQSTGKEIQLDLKQLIDMAIGNPDIGSVNFNLLHTLLVILLRHLDLSNIRVEFQGSEAEMIKDLLNSGAYNSRNDITEYNIAYQKEGAVPVERSELPKKDVNTILVVKEQSKSNEKAKKPTVEGLKRPSDGPQETKEVSEYKATTLITRDEFNPYVRQIAEMREVISNLPRNAEELLGVIKTINHDPNKDLWQALRAFKRLEQIEMTINDIFLVINALAKEMGITTPLLPNRFEMTSTLSGDVPQRLHKLEKQLNKLLTQMGEIGPTGMLAPSEMASIKTAISATAPYGDKKDTENQLAADLVSKISESGMSGTHPSTMYATVTKGDQRVGQTGSHHSGRSTPGRDVSHGGGHDDGYGGGQGGGGGQGQGHGVSHDGGHGGGHGGGQGGGHPGGKTGGQIASSGIGPSPHHQKGAQHKGEPPLLLNTANKVTFLIDEVTKLKKDLITLCGKTDEEGGTATSHLDSKIHQRFVKIERWLDQIDTSISEFQLHIYELDKELSEISDRVDIALEAAKKPEGEITGISELYEMMGVVKDDIEFLKDEIRVSIDFKSKIVQRSDEMNAVLEMLTKCKVNTYDLDEMLAEKADFLLVEQKVGMDYFDVFKRDVRETITELVTKYSNLKKNSNMQFMEFDSRLNDCLPTLTFNQFNDTLNGKLQTMCDRIKAVAMLHKDSEAAGTKMKFLKNVNCISCDSKVVMRIEDQSIPKQSQMAPGKSLKPFLTYELDNIRKQMSKDGKNMLHFEALSKDRKEPDHSVNRYCGGSHTLFNPCQKNKVKQPRVTSAGGIHKPEYFVEGNDGAYYRGRVPSCVCARIKKTPSVEIKSAECDCEPSLDQPERERSVHSLGRTSQGQTIPESRSVQTARSNQTAQSQNTVPSHHSGQSQQTAPHSHHSAESHHSAQSQHTAQSRHSAQSQHTAQSHHTVQSHHSAQSQHTAQSRHSVQSQHTAQSHHSAQSHQTGRSPTQSNHDAAPPDETGQEPAEQTEEPQTEPPAPEPENEVPEDVQPGTPQPDESAANPEEEEHPAEEDNPSEHNEEPPPTE